MYSNECSDARLFKKNYLLEQRERGSTSPAIAVTYLPALTRNMMHRGFLMESTNDLKSLKPSRRPAVGAKASSPMTSRSYLSTQVSTLDSLRLHTEMLNPFSATFSARFCPITPRPYRPMSVSPPADLLAMLLLLLCRCRRRRRRLLALCAATSSVLVSDVSELSQMTQIGPTYRTYTEYLRTKRTRTYVITTTHHDGHNVTMSQTKNLNNLPMCGPGGALVV